MKRCNQCNDQIESTSLRPTIEHCNLCVSGATVVVEETAFDDDSPTTKQPTRWITVLN